MRSTIIALCMGTVVLGLAADARADEVVMIRNPSELTAGVVTATLGGASLATGTAMSVAAGIFASCSFCSNDAKVYAEIGIPLAVAGIIATVAGVWMAYDGGHRERPRWSLSPVGFAATF